MLSNTRKESMFMNEPLVSIVIPCYNCEDYVAQAIDSALNQTYGNIEVICVDDGSKDNSRKIIERYSDKIIIIDNINNQGVIEARNKAISIAKGELILPLDADDLIDKDYVSKAVDVFLSNPDIGLVYCNARLIGSKNKLWKLPEYDENIIFRNCIFATALFRKTDFIKAGGYKSYMQKGCEDWDLWLTFIEMGLKPYKLSDCLFYYRQYVNGGNNRNALAVNFLDEVNTQIFKHHIDLYIKNKQFYKRVFYRYFEDFDIIKKKFKKYKNLYNILLIISIFEFLFILFL